MKVLVAFALVAMMALPSLAQSGVDNCCQIGRSCANAGEWIQGALDYQDNVCDIAPMMSDSDNMSGAAEMNGAGNMNGAGDMSETGEASDAGGMQPAANSYFFSGKGRGETSAFRLTRGKWDLRIRSSQTAVGLMLQQGDGSCFAIAGSNHPGFWTINAGHGWVTQTAVRYECDATIEIATYPDSEWKVFLQKVDGNI